MVDEMGPKGLPKVEHDPWVPSAVLRDIVREAPADERLLVDLVEVRAALVEDSLT